MIISKSDSNYLIKLLDNNIDIYNREDLEKITEKIYKKIIKKNKLNNLILLEFYVDKLYGTIIILKDYKKLITFNDEIEIKITIHNDTSFLYKIDYFDIKKYNLEKENIYYYENNFYLEIKGNLSKRKYFNILELSEIIYENSYEIIDKGIKINI